MDGPVQNTTHRLLYSGGLAELVHSPSELTYSFFRHWFTGSGSVGHAMEILGLPFQRLPISVFNRWKNELVVDLSNEEKILYGSTIFEYSQQKNLHSTPVLTVKPIRIINPLYLANTLRILLIQSQWIAHPEQMIKRTRELVDSIPRPITDCTLSDLDNLLIKRVWPTILAVGMITEFYSQLLNREAKESNSAVYNFISCQMRRRDWFFLSLTDQEKVRNGSMNFTDYMQHYGARADKDYDLAVPRWHEDPDEVHKRILEYRPIAAVSVSESSCPQNLIPLANTIIELQLLRSKAKHKALLVLDLLRKEIVKTTQKRGVGIEKTTYERLFGINEKVNSLPIGELEQANPHRISTPSSGKGTPVSSGMVTGIVTNITDIHTPIAAGTIGIFPNASPEFAIQFPRCSGMIFLRGGQTSHGAIVAREFGIPALIDNSMEGVKDGAQLTLNGMTGEWNIN